MCMQVSVTTKLNVAPDDIGRAGYTTNDPTGNEFGRMVTVFWMVQCAGILSSMAEVQESILSISNRQGTDQASQGFDLKLIFQV